MSKRLIFSFVLSSIVFSAYGMREEVVHPDDGPGDFVDDRVSVSFRKEISGFQNGRLKTCPLEDVNEGLAEQVIQSQKKDIGRFVNRLQYFKKLDNPVSSVLFVGSSGCGKSTLAKYIPQKYGWNCFFVKSSIIADQFKASGSQNLSVMFRSFLDSKSPTVLVMDELDMVTDKGKNENDTDSDMMGTLWMFLDDCKQNKNILFVATTNNYDKLPDPLKTRFARGLHKFKDPSFVERKDIIKYHLGKYNGLSQCGLLALSLCWDGQSPREIEGCIASVIEDKQFENLILDKSKNDFLITFDDIRKHGLKMRWSRYEKIKSTLCENPGTVGFVAGGALTLGICLLQNKFSWALHKAQVEVQNNLYGRQLDDTRRNAAMDVIGSFHPGKIIVEVLREDSKMGDAIKELSAGGKKLLHLDDPKVIPTFDNITNVVKSINETRHYIAKIVNENPLLKYAILLCFCW